MMTTTKKKKKKKANHSATRSTTMQPNPARTDRPDQARPTMLLTLGMALALCVTTTSPRAQGSGSGSGSAVKATPAAGKTEQPGQPTAARVQPSKAARAALAEAAAVLKRAKGAKGEARKAFLRDAAMAYEKVASDFAAEPAGAATASFEAADVWRRHGDLAKAGACFQKAMTIDAGRYQARCTLELAHIARRQKSIDGAVELYERVAKLEPRSARGHQARLWLARCLDGQGKRDAAVAAYRAAVDGAATPRQQIEACNRLANLLVRAGDLAGAVDVVARAEQISKAGATTDTPAGKRAALGLGKAFANMSARRALQRAQDKANGAHRDAQRVEKSGGAGATGGNGTAGGSGR